MTAMDFRQYDSAIGRFNSIDVLSELTPDWTPYRFALNNPVFWADPTGLTEETNPVNATCPTCPNTPAFKPLIDDPNNEYVYDPETKTASIVTVIEEVVIVGKVKPKQSNLDWWVIEGLPNRSKKYDKAVNLTLGAYGTMFSTFDAWLNKERKLLENRGTQTALKKLTKYVNPSISKISKVTKPLGVVGATISAGSLGYDIVSGNEVTGAQVFDTTVAVALTLLTVTNPFAIGGLAIYTVIDMYGGFDGLKESAGLNKVIINKK